jgi:hypothetical protein
MSSIMRWLPWKQPSLRPRRSPPFAQPFEQLRREHHIAIPLILALLDPQRHALAVYIGHLLGLLWRSRALADKDAFDTALAPLRRFAFDEAGVAFRWKDYRIKGRDGPSGSSTPSDLSPGLRPCSPISPATPTASRSPTRGLSQRTVGLVELYDAPPVSGTAAVDRRSARPRSSCCSTEGLDASSPREPMCIRGSDSVETSQRGVDG